MTRRFVSIIDGNSYEFVDYPRDKKRKYPRPWELLEIGQTVTIGMHEHPSARTRIAEFRKESGRRFATRVIPPGETLQIWRLS